MPLRPRLVTEIVAEGPLTIARYMELCLHDPQAGYYATRPAIGAVGDFVTAPGVSQMFGELVGLWCAQTWRALGAPEPVSWIELGPGDATLMRDMRRALARAAPEWLAAARTVLVETSPPLRRRQADALQLDTAVRPFAWASSFLEAVEADDAPAIIVANEFLDCLPVRQFVRTEAGWAERRVGLSPEGELSFGLTPAPQGFATPVELGDPPLGSLLEQSAAQARLGAELGRYVARRGGAALLIDYGRDQAGYGDTLQSLSAHAKVDPLATPGEADLTAHVDFPAVAAAARAAGAATTPIVGQAEFLARLGIATRAQALARAQPDRAATVARQLARLTGADAMGVLFKVLVIHTPGLAVPGFEDA